MKRNEILMGPPWLPIPELRAAGRFSDFLNMLILTSKDLPA